MKTCIQTLGIMAIAASLSYGQDAPKKPERKRPNPEEIFKKLDTDNSGGINLDEFKASPRAQKNPSKSEGNFKKIDSDSNGQISLEEFKAHRPKRPAHGGDRPGNGGHKTGGDAPAGN